MTGPDAHTAADDSLSDERNSVNALTRRRPAGKGARAGAFDAGQSLMVKRVHEAFTARSEKRLLVWIATRLPPSVTPDQLTLLGLAGSLVSFFGYIACWLSPGFLWLASLGLVIQWFGDSLDGSLARVRRIERPRYGFIVDHASDIVSQGLFAIGIGLSPYIRLVSALLALVAYMAVSVVSFLRLHVTGDLHLSYSGVGPTEMRLLLIVGNAILFFVGSMPLRFMGLRIGVPDVLALAVFVFGTTSAFFGAWTTAREIAEVEITSSPRG